MRAYLVRVVEGKEIVGIYTADTLGSLFDLIDQCTNPRECEVATLPEGGIYWPSRGTPILRSVDDLENDDDFSGMELCEQWGLALLGKLSWRSGSELWPRVEQVRA